MARSMKKHPRAMRTLAGTAQLFWSFFFPPAPPSEPPVPACDPAPSSCATPAQASALTTDAALTQQAAGLLRGIGCATLADRVQVRWHRRLVSTAGLARAERAEVQLNPRLQEFPGEVDRTLRHELAHLAAHDRAGRRRITAHGAEWRLACSDLGIPGETRCHALPLGRRAARCAHVYRCPGCATTLRRARPINARRHRLACRECCRRHAGGRFDGRFEFVKVSAREAGCSTVEG